MKKLFASIILLALSSTVFAQTHREHVGQRLEAASEFLKKTSADISTLGRHYDPTHPSHVGRLSEANFRGNVDYVHLYISKSQNSIAEILSAVPWVPAPSTVGEIDLLDLRRAINMPFEGALCTSEDLCELNAPFESLAYEMSVVNRYLHRLSGACILDPNWLTHDCGTNLFQGGQNFSFAWAEVEFAIWHMNDAIYQEVHGQ